MTERLVTDPLSGEQVPPANEEVAAICLDARDICLLAADLAVRGEGFGSGDVAAEALGLSPEDAAYHTAYHTALNALRRLHEQGVYETTKVSEMTSDHILTAYLEAAAALQQYAASANPN